MAMAANATTAISTSTKYVITTAVAATTYAVGTTMPVALNCSALNASAGDVIPVQCSAYSWLIAVAIIVCGTVVNNLGVNFQKLALGMRSQKPAPKIPWKLVWIVGIIAIVVGSVCDFLALGFGDQILVTPLTSMSLVWNLIFASIIQKEKISVMDGVWTAVIIAGCVLTVVFASHENTSYSADQLFAFYGDTPFIVFAVLVVLVLIALGVFGKWADRVERRQGTNSAAYKRIAKIHLLSYPCASGLVGAQSISFGAFSVCVLLLLVLLLLLLVVMVGW
jgi:drug/metabolite transporter (DMT)-like permease